MSRWVWAVAAALVTIELVPAGRYGMSHDEFYFIACAEHLDFGYVDHPPLVVLLTATARALFGDALLGLRLMPALAGAATVLSCAAIARALGGGRFAQLLGAVAVSAALILVAMFNVMTMNPFDIMLVSWCAYVLVRILDGAPPSHWMYFGLLAGVGLQNKLTPLMFGFATCVALLATPSRRLLASLWPWLGAALALLIFLPNLVWQAAHGWPTLEFMRSVLGSRNPGFTPFTFFGQVALVANPLTAPLWMGGLLYLLWGRGAAHHRAVGVAALVFLAIYAAGNSQVYYVAPILPLLFAAGAVGAERLAAATQARWLRAALLAPLAISALVFAPLSVPLLPVERFIEYSGRIGLIESVTMHSTHRLPVYFATRFGWPELVDTVERVWQVLPDQDRERCIILGNDYAKACAVNLLGRDAGLPPAYSGHNSCWYWGPPGDRGEVAISIGYREQFLQSIYESVEQVAVVQHPYANPWQTDQPVFVCRGLKAPLVELWPRFKHFG